MAATAASEAAVASMTKSNVGAVGVRASSATPEAVAVLQPVLVAARHVRREADSAGAAPLTTVSVMARLVPLQVLTYSVPPAGTRDMSTLWRPIMVRPVAGRAAQPAGPLLGGAAQVSVKGGSAERGACQATLSTPFMGGK